MNRQVRRSGFGTSQWAAHRPAPSQTTTLNWGQNTHTNYWRLWRVNKNIFPPLCHIHNTWDVAQNDVIYQESGKCDPRSKENTINRDQLWHDPQRPTYRNWQDFKEALIRLSKVRENILTIIEKLGNLSREIWNTTKKPNGNFKTEKFSIWSMITGYA